MDDDAVEAVVYQSQQAAKQLCEQFHRSSPFDRVLTTRSSDRRPVESKFQICLASILGFVRIMTRRGILPNPMIANDAIGRVRSWLAVPGVEILTPGERHSEILFGLLERVGTAGNLTTDAHLAALAIEYQAEVASTDTDFARFPGLRWFNPVR